MADEACRPLLAFSLGGGNRQVCLGLTCGRGLLCDATMTPFLVGIFFLNNLRRSCPNKNDIAPKAVKVISQPNDLQVPIKGLNIWNGV